MSTVLANEPHVHMKFLDNNQSVILHSGDVVTRGNVTHRALAPIEETAEALDAALEYYAETVNGPPLAYDGCVHFDNCRCNNPFNESERPFLKITQKVFLYGMDGSLMRDAVHNLLKYFNTGTIDNLIVCIPNSQLDQIADSKNMAALLDLWKHVERLIDEGAVVHAGLTATPLEMLRHVYENANHKPDLLQVDTSLCCHVPDELKAFTAEHGTKLLVSREPNEMLSDSDLNALFNKHFTHGDAPSSCWNLEWLMRYTVLCDRHSVIRNKGYAIKALKEERSK